MGDDLSVALTQSGTTSQCQRPDWHQSADSLIIVIARTADPATSVNVKLVTLCTQIANPKVNLKLVQRGYFSTISSISDRQRRKLLRLYYIWPALFVGDLRRVVKLEFIHTVDGRIWQEAARSACVRLTTLIISPLSLVEWNLPLLARHLLSSFATLYNLCNTKHVEGIRFA